MIKSFQNRIRESLKERKLAELPNIWLVVTAASLFTVFFCIIAVLAVPSDKPPEFNFMEGGAINALSAMYMSLGCGFAIASSLVHFRKQGSFQWLWIIVATGLAFLAFDELVEFHERFGRMLSNRDISISLFRNWNDLIVILYGVVAVPVALILLPQLVRYKWVIELFTVAFVFYVIHTAIDSTQDPPTLISHVFEESAKLFSVTFLALGAFIGFLGNLWGDTFELEKPESDPDLG